MPQLLPLHRHQAEAVPESSGTVWNEDDEIRYVLQEEQREEDHQEHSIRVRSVRESRMLRFPNRQSLRARHVPSPLYMPVVIAEWYVFLRLDMWYILCLMTIIPIILIILVLGRFTLFMYCWTQWMNTSNTTNRRVPIM